MDLTEVEVPTQWAELAITGMLLAYDRVRLDPELADLEPPAAMCGWGYRGEMPGATYSVTMASGALRKDGSLLFDERRGVACMWLATYGVQEIVALRPTTTSIVDGDGPRVVEVLEARYAAAGYEDTLLAEVPVSPGERILNLGVQLDLNWIPIDDLAGHDLHLAVNAVAPIGLRPSEAALDGQDIMVMIEEGQWG